MATVKDIQPILAPLVLPIVPYASVSFWTKYDLENNMTTCTSWYHRTTRIGHNLAQLYRHSNRHGCRNVQPGKLSFKSPCVDTGIALPATLIRPNRGCLLMTSPFCHDDTGFTLTGQFYIPIPHKLRYKGWL